MDKTQKQTFAFTTSWGVSTRLIGALIMAHSDDDGLVLPPRIAPFHVILIPVVMKEADQARVYDYCDELIKDLKKLNFHNEAVRIEIDKTYRRAGEKFWNAVKKGVPIRIEIGVREIDADKLTVTRRDKPAKEAVVLSREKLISQICNMLDEIHHTLFDRALKFRETHTHHIKNLEELKTLFGEDENQLRGFALAHFDPAVEANAETSEQLKAMKLTTRCLPFGEQDKEGQCIFSGKKTKHQVIFARAY